MADWTSSMWSGRVAATKGAWSGDDPAATQLARQMANNANHLADAYSQPRVAMPLVAGTAGFREAALPFGASGADDPALVMTIGPFPLSLREDGSPKRLRVRIGGASIKGSGVTFIVRVHPAGLPGDIDPREVTTSSTSSATAAWLSAGTDLFTLSASDAGHASRGISTRVALLGTGGVTRITWPLFEASVYAYGTTITAQEASLCGLSIAELRGEP